MDLNAVSHGLPLGIWLIIGIAIAGGIGLALAKSWPRIRDARYARKVERENKKRKDAEKKLNDVKKSLAPAPSPPPATFPAPPNSTQASAGVATLEEFKEIGGSRLAVEFTRIKEGTHRRITVARGQVPIVAGRDGDMDKILIMVRGHRGYFVNPKKIIKVTTTAGRFRRGNKEVVSYKVVYDVLFGEALNQDGTVTWDEDLEMILADSGLDQYVTIAAYEVGFKLTPTLKNVMILIGFMGLLIGMALNGSSHFIPTTIIHWVP